MQWLLDFVSNSWPIAVAWGGYLAGVTAWLKNYLDAKRLAKPPDEPKLIKIPSDKEVQEFSRPHRFNRKMLLVWVVLGLGLAFTTVQSLQDRNIAWHFEAAANGLILRLEKSERETYELAVRLGDESGKSLRITAQAAYQEERLAREKVKLARELIEVLESSNIDKKAERLAEAGGILAAAENDLVAATQARKTIEKFVPGPVAEVP